MKDTLQTTIEEHVGGLKSSHRFRKDENISLIVHDLTSDKRLVSMWMFLNMEG